MTRRTSPAANAPKAILNPALILAVLEKTTRTHPFLCLLDPV